MALFRTGGMIGQISGSIGPNVFTHGRYGAYIRPRVTPVKTGTQKVLQARFDFGQISAAWDLLDDGDRAAWKDWAQSNPITNRIGDKQILSANAAFVMLNARIVAIGATIIQTPPTSGAPVPIIITSGTATAGTPTLSLVLGTSPVPADTVILMHGCAIDSPGINYVENKLKRVGIIDEAETTPFNALPDWTNTIGTLAKGQRLFIDYVTMGSTSGLQTVKQRLIITVAT